MRRIKLFTKDGNYVTTLEVPPFVRMPEMTTWGIRSFIRYDLLKDAPVFPEEFNYLDQPQEVYVEGFNYTYCKPEYVGLSHRESLEENGAKV